MHLQYITAIRQAHTQAIAFICPPVFQAPPNLPVSHTQKRLALSSHFYDAMTMMGKRRHVFNADAVSLTRGEKSMLGVIKLGNTNIVNGMEQQMEKLRSDGWNKESVAGQTDEATYPSASYPSNLACDADVSSHHRRDGRAFRYERACHAWPRKGQASRQGLQRSGEGYGPEPHGVWYVLPVLP